MNAALLLIGVACLLCIVGMWRTVASHAQVSTKKLLLIEVALGDITGRQMRLAEEYRDVHAILKQIRDLNKEELQERKEILQQRNVVMGNRVQQGRQLLAELEEAAQRELDGLRGNR